MTRLLESSVYQEAARQLCVSNENHRASCHSRFGPNSRKCQKTPKKGCFGITQKNSDMLDPPLSPFLLTPGASCIQQHQWPCTVKIPSLRRMGSLPTRRLRFDFSHSAALLGSIMRAALQSARHNQCSPRAFTFTLQNHGTLQPIFVISP